MQAYIEKLDPLQCCINTAKTSHLPCFNFVLYVSLDRQLQPKTINKTILESIKK